MTRACRSVRMRAPAKSVQEARWSHFAAGDGRRFRPAPTKDLDTAVDFYGETLGLPRSVYIPERNFAEFETGNLTLSVINAREDGNRSTSSTATRSRSTSTTSPRLATAGGRGVEFQGEILDTGVCHMAFFSDPDGNALMLHHRYAPRQTDS